MIFRPEHIIQIINGTKWQTRRIAKANETFAGFNDESVITNADVVYGTVRLKWTVGRDYAVQPGRGKRGVWYDSKTGEFYEVEDYNHKTLLFAKKCLPLRIKILDIGREELRDIAVMDAWAEGVGSVTKYAALWDSINNLPGTRWEDNPQVWVIKFEVLS